MFIYFDSHIININLRLSNIKTCPEQHDMNSEYQPETHDTLVNLSMWRSYEDPVIPILMRTE